MIYLLSGLLIVHGVICLLGAFFPFYPPVYLFYVFFPGHFAIRLIIVLLAGASQVVYGGYLLLKKRWQVRWYWLALTVVVFAGLLLISPAFQGLFTRIPTATPEPPPYPSARPGPERPDDIVPTPGGPQYRANVHQEGVENPWPPIQTEEVVLADDVHVTYRAYIETNAGEGRNNIVYLRIPGKDIGNINFRAINPPAGIEVKRGIQWHGPRTIAQVLVIEISQDVEPGQYTFEIGVEIDGKDYGTIPCTIEVREDSADVPTKTEKKITSKGVHINWGEGISFHGYSVLPDGTYLQTQLYEYGNGEQPVAWWPADKYIQVQDGEWQITVPLDELSENITKLYIGSETFFLFKVWEKDNPLVTDTYGFDLKGPPPIPEP